MPELNLFPWQCVSRYFFFILENEKQRERNLFPLGSIGGNIYKGDGM
jgi:hypothetical protein